MVMADDTAASTGTLAYELIASRNLPKGVNVAEDELREFAALGKFKMAASGFGWKCNTTGAVTTVPAENIAKFEWLRAFRGYQLRILTRDEQLLKFDGFPGTAQQELAQYSAMTYKVPFELVDVNFSGKSIGLFEASGDGKQLEFRVEDHLAFDFPVDSVVAAAVTMANELTLDLAEPKSFSGDLLTQIKFHMEPPEKPAKDSDEEAEELEKLAENPAELIEQEEREMEEEEENDEASRMCDFIRSGSQAAAAPGAAILSLPDLQCLIPRGRYDCDFGKDYMRLHGKTYDYKVPFAGIQKLFLLPKADEANILLVMALDPPLRQGQTRYPFLLFQFAKEEFVEVDVEDTPDSKQFKLERRYEGPLFEVASTLVRVMTGQKIIVPGTFRSSIRGLPCIRGAFKANEGHLYMLEKSLLFLPKPVFMFSHNEIDKVMLGRTGPGLGNPRSFDIKLVLKQSSMKDFSLSNVPKEDLPAIEDYFASKGISVVKEGAERSKYRVDLSSSEDDNGDSEDASDNDGKAKKRRKLATTDSEVDEESPDEDYNEDEEDEESSFDEDEEDEDEEDYESDDE